MPICEVWDIVSVPLSIDDGSATERRPALVVARIESPGRSNLLWVLMITSAANAGRNDDVALSTLEGTGLGAESVVRAAKITTLAEHHVSVIGKLPEIDRQIIAQYIAARLTNIGQQEEKGAGERLCAQEAITE